MMHCIFCYINPILIKNPKNKAKKSLILCNTTNGITTLKKHVSTNYYILGKKFEEEMNSLLKRKEEKQPTKKRPNISRCFISNLFVTKELSRKMICNKIKFWKLLGVD